MTIATKGIIGGFAIAIIGIVFGWIGFPMLLKSMLAKNAALVKGTETRKMWEKMPIAVEFKVYLFNVTNPEEAANGAVPIVQEVGPYFYDEWKEKTNIVDHSGNDSVSFNMVNTFIYNQSMTKGYTGDEMITLPHMVILGMVYAVEKLKPGALGVLNKAIPNLFNKPKTPFLTVKVRDVLFDGVPINCTSKDFATSAICTEIRANPKGLKVVDNNIFLFSFFGAKNGTADDHKLTVKRGSDNSDDVGIVVLVDDLPKSKVWDGDPCNDFFGTDSTVFPPFRTPADDVTAYSADLCRSIAAKYENPVEYKGIPCMRYTANLGDQSTIPDEKCYCPTPTTCLKKGLFDIAKCTGAPIVTSLPHFYLTDESYMSTVKGLNPEQAKHEIYMNIEPLTGLPLAARKRLQFNVMTHPVEKISIMKNLASSLLPIFWVEEGLDMNDAMIGELDSKLFGTIRMVNVVRWVLIGVGVAVALVGTFFHFYKRQKLTISPKPSAENGNNVTNGEKGKF